jgi:hypothetical protein
MTGKNVNLNRALGGGERQWWVQSQRVPCNIALATCIDAPVDRAAFERAVVWLQRRYPLLAASLEITAGEPRFVTGHAPPISLTWVERKSADDWRAPTAKDLATAFPQEGPFVRFTVFAGNDATDVVLCVSHMLVDGLSMAQIFADVVRFLHDPLIGDDPVPDHGTLDERAPQTYRKRWFPFVRHILSQVFGAPNDPARNARLAAGYHGRLNVDWITTVLAPEDTERLRAKSRAEGTTVQGALTAAWALAVGEREKARYGRKRIAVHSPINLRKLLEPPVVSEIGNYAAGTTTWLRCDAPLWDLARAVKGDIDQALARGVPFANERLAKGAKRSTPRTSPRWIALRLWPDLGVTNLGSVTPPDTPLGAKVREMHVLVALPVMETLVCATVTIRRRLICDFHYCPDDVSREEALRMVESAKRHLKAAIDS